MLTNKGSFAEVRQLIAGTNFTSFLTPDMASKNDARHGIGLFSASITRVANLGPRSSLA